MPIPKAEVATTTFTRLAAKSSCAWRRATSGSRPL